MYVIRLIKVFSIFRVFRVYSLELIFQYVYIFRIVKRNTCVYSPFSVLEYENKEVVFIQHSVFIQMNYMKWSLFTFQCILQLEYYSAVTRRNVSS